MGDEPTFSRLFRDTVPSGKESIRYFDECYAELHQAVYSNIVKLIRDPLKAEDILQDVFLAFWENMDRLEPGRIANWLYVVSFNKSMNYLSGLRKHTSLSVLENTGFVAEDTGIDEADFERKLLLIDEAVEQLSERKKEIFRMYRLEGKSLHEISSELELSVHTIKDHLKITHKLIRAYLNQNRLHYTGIELCLLLLLLY